MVYHELLEEVKQLPRDARQSLLEYLRHDLEAAPPPSPAPRRSLLELRGVLRMEPVPSDAQVAELLEAALMEKYG